MTVKSRVFGPAGVSLLCVSIAAACPLCQTDPGQQVRDGIFGPDFWLNLFYVLLPFPVFFSLAAALHYGFRRKTPSAKGAESTEAKHADNMKVMAVPRNVSRPEEVERLARAATSKSAASDALNNVETHSRLS